MREVTIPAVWDAPVQPSSYGIGAEVPPWAYDQFSKAGVNYLNYAPYAKGGVGSALREGRYGPGARAGGSYQGSLAGQNGSAGSFLAVLAIAGVAMLLLTPRS